MSARFTIDALALVAAMVDAFGAAVPLEHLVRQLGPPLARVLDPFATVKLAGLRCAAAFRVRAIGPLEPLLPVALDAIVLTFRDHQMCVRIVLVAVAVPTGMDRKRVRQLLVGGQVARKGMSELDLIVRLEIAWQREVGRDVQPVRAFEQVRGIPVLLRVVLSAHDGM